MSSTEIDSASSKLGDMTEQKAVDSKTSPENYSTHVSKGTDTSISKPTFANSENVLGERPTASNEPQSVNIPPAETEKMKSLPNYELRKNIGRYWCTEETFREEDGWISDVEWEHRMRHRLDALSGEETRRWVLMIDDFLYELNERKPTLEIASPYLKKVIHSVVKFDPTVDWFSDRLFIAFPFRTFFHHWDDIQAAIETDKDASENENTDFEVLKLVHNNLPLGNDRKDTIKSHHEAIREYLKSGEINYKDIWAVYKPGSRVLIRDNLGEWQMLMVVSCENMNDERLDARQQTKELLEWKVRMWQMTWDNANECFTRTLWCRTIHPFSGTKQVSKLPVLPFEFYEDNDRNLPRLQSQELLQQTLKERGNKWADFIRNDPACLHFEGAAGFLGRSESGRRFEDGSELLSVVNLKGRVVVDQRRDFEIGDLHKIENDEMDVIASDDRPQYAVFDDNPRREGFEPTGIQAMLCPAAVECFHLESQKWYLVPVNHLRRILWKSDTLETLVLAEQKKSLLVDLLESYRTDRHEGAQDPIEGKGTGLVILLHGPSGVGKTLTAEVVAEHLHQPLQSISLSELVNNNEDFESYILAMFRQASRQRVVLLLDEADVILEERACEDVKRNSVVSILLRTIEYFDGIVFLTTNRPGVLDPSFESRIHLSIEFPQLNVEARKRIWKQFLQNLEPKVESNVTEVLDNLDFLVRYELNGRQIRNVINVSAAIARARTGGELNVKFMKNLAGETSGMFERLRRNANDPKSWCRGEGLHGDSRYK